MFFSCPKEKTSRPAGYKCLSLSGCKFPSDAKKKERSVRLQQEFILARPGWRGLSASTNPRVLLLLSVDRQQPKRETEIQILPSFSSSRTLPSFIPPLSIPTGAGHRSGVALGLRIRVYPLILSRLPPHPKTRNSVHCPLDKFPWCLWLWVFPSSGAGGSW